MNLSINNFVCNSTFLFIIIFKGIMMCLKSHSIDLSCCHFADQGLKNFNPVHIYFFILVHTFLELHDTSTKPILSGTGSKISYNNIYGTESGAKKFATMVRHGHNKVTPDSAGRKLYYSPCMYMHTDE